jgi:hypothetical protein
MSGGPRYVGLPAVRAPRCFQLRVRVSRPTVPRNFRYGFIPSCVSVLFGVPSLAYRASPCGSAPSCRGSLPSSRHHQVASTGAEDSQPPLRSVLRFSQPLDGFLRHSAVRACFIPQPRPGFPFRGLLPLRSRADSSPAVPPCPYRRVTHRLPGCHDTSTGLRGFHPRGDSYAVGRGLAFRRRRPLFGFLLLQVLLPHRARGSWPPSSAHDLRFGVFIGTVAPLSPLAGSSTC